MQKNNTQSFEFSKKIKLNFEGGEISSDAGLLVVHEFCEKFGVQKLLKNLLPENRNKIVIHDKPEILYQEIIRIIGGYQSNNFAKYLQNDPTFKNIHEKIASSSTCCRLEKEFSIKDLKQLQKLQNKLLDQAYELEKPKEVFLDLDTTYDPASGKIEGSTYNTHYGETGYSPLFCTDGKTGDIIKAHLRPGNTACSKKVVPFIKPLLKRYRSLNIIVKSRMDSGFAAPEIYDLYEKNANTYYYIKLKKNAVLDKKVNDILEKHKIEQTKKKEIFTDIKYKTKKSWQKERRVLLHIHLDEDKLIPDYAAIVTNDEEIIPEDGIKFYRGRSRIEKHIEESKNGFSSDHLSHKSFVSNMVKFQLFILAQLIINIFRRLTFPEKESTFSIASIRIFILKIGAKVIINSRNLVFKCSSCFPYAKLFLTILKNIQTLPRFG